MSPFLISSPLFLLLTDTLSSHCGVALQIKLFLCSKKPNLPQQILFLWQVTVWLDLKMEATDKRDLRMILFGNTVFYYRMFMVSIIWEKLVDYFYLSYRNKSNSPESTSMSQTICSTLLSLSKQQQRSITLLYSRCWQIKWEINWFDAWNSLVFHRP